MIQVRYFYNFQIHWNIPNGVYLHILVKINGKHSDSITVLLKIHVSLVGNVCWNSSVISNQTKY